MASVNEQINEAFAYLHGLWNYRWSALLITGLVAVLGWVAVYAIPNQYMANAAVHMDTTSIMQPLLQGLSVETNPEEDLELMSRLLLNRENLFAVIRETDMDLQADTEVEKEALVSQLARSVSIKQAGPGRGRRGSGSGIYDINYTSTSAEEAFKVVSTLLNMLIEKTLSSGRVDTIMAEEFLDKQIKDYEERLAAAEARMAEFKKKNVGFMPNEKGDYFARIRHAQQEIDDTKSELTQAKQRYSELNRQLSGEGPMMAGSYEKMRRYREQLVDLLAQYTAEHPDVQALKSKIADLEAGGSGGAVGLPDDRSSYNPVYQEIKVQESQARVEVGRLQIQLVEKQKKLNELQQSIDIIPQVEADLAKLNRDYDITRDRYTSLVERRESARLAQSVDRNSSAITFKVIDPPVVPHEPAGPDRPLLLAGVMLSALVAGFGWCVIRFILHPTFVDYKQLTKAVDFPVLGAISLQMGPEERRSRRLHLTTFLMALIMVFGVFGGVLFYQQQGSAQVRTILAEMGISL
jgi:polysaccharide chain length determinant protein (PEP-CTERM system associated)